MNYKQFLKTTYKTEFIKTDYGDIVGKQAILEKIEGLVERFLASGSTEEEIQDFRDRIIGDYEIYDEKLKTKTKALMKKWSLEL